MKKVIVVIVGTAAAVTGYKYWKKKKGPETETLVVEPLDSSDGS